MDPKFDVNKLAVFDLEYVFLKLRAISVDNMVKVSYKDNEDQKVYDFEIDLNKIEVKFPEKTENNIKITNNTCTVYQDSLLIQIGINLKTQYNLETLYTKAKRGLRLHEGATPPLARPWSYLKRRIQ